MVECIQFSGSGSGNGGINQVVIVYDLIYILPNNFGSNHKTYKFSNRTYHCFRYQAINGPNSNEMVCFKQNANFRKFNKHLLPFAKCVREK